MLKNGSGSQQQEKPENQNQNTKSKPGELSPLPELTLSCQISTESPHSTEQLIKICQQWDFWSYPMLKEAIDFGNYLLLTTPADTEPYGTLLACHGAFSADIIYIHVAASERGKGTGKLLIRRLLHILKDKGDYENLFLEVRTSNLAAIRLYESVGMKQQGIRKRYYPDGEDAFVYSLSLK